MQLNKATYSYFLILFSVIPVTIILGPKVSLLNILLIDISFIILILKSGNFSFIKNNSIKFLIFLYIYLIFNSLISIDLNSGIYRNLGFIRIIILFVAFNYFFNQKLFLDRLLRIWLLIFLVVSFDVFLEYLTGTNSLGYPPTGEGHVTYGSRIVSFFKDEPIVGGYINGFFLILIGFLANKYYFKKNSIIFFISIIFLLAIFLTGERSNTIKAFLGILILVFLFKNINLKFKIAFLIVSSLSILILLFNSDYFKIRYITQIKSSLSSQSQYLNLYKSGFQVFKNYPWFGVGNKNYRVETCNTLKNADGSLRLQLDNKEFNKYWCSTHPHQIYFEFLSEHGFLGTILVFYIIFKLVLSRIFEVLNDTNYIQIGSMIFILTTFLPLLPSGAFFSNYAITIFGINLSIFYASNKNFNIFSKLG